MGIPNGTPVSEISETLTWYKSDYSGANGNCVEFAALDDATVAVRNSRDPQGAALIYTRAEIGALLAGAKDGQFDHLV